MGFHYTAQDDGNKQKGAGQAPKKLNDLFNCSYCLIGATAGGAVEEEHERDTEVAEEVHTHHGRHVRDVTAFELLSCHLTREHRANGIEQEVDPSINQDENNYRGQKGPEQETAH